MPFISLRAQQMPASPIRKLVPLANAARAAGIKVYPLNIGQPDLPSPPQAMEAIRNYDFKLLPYSPSEGLLSLRERMSEYYASVGVHAAPDQIMITSGGSEALFFAMMACLGPGDEFILPEPAYANYLGFAKEADVNVVPVRSDIYNGFALPPISEIEKLITPRTRAILICNPNNPTGYVYSQEELEALRDIVIKHDLFLISDEVYREFCYRGSTAISAFSLEGVDDNVVVVDSVSKRYDECGIRIGTLVTRNKMLYKAVMKYAQARLSPPLLGQVVAEASIGASEEYMKATYDEYISRRDLLVNGLNDIPGVFSPLPMGAFYTVASLPVDDAEEFCRWCLTDFEYQGQTVFMAPAAGFYSNPEDGRNQVRIAYILEKPELTRALQVLEQALRTYNSRADKNSGILRQAQYAG